MDTIGVITVQSHARVTTNTGNETTIFKTCEVNISLLGNYHLSINNGSISITFIELSSFFE